MYTKATIVYGKIHEHIEQLEKGNAKNVDKTTLTFVTLLYANI